MTELKDLEKNSRRRTRKTTLQKAILGSVATAGVLSVALLAPNAMQVLKMFGYKPWKRQKEIINRARERLLKQGLLERNFEEFLRITKKGERILRKIEIAEGKYKIKQPKKWDRKWRVMIFDIPEERRKTRAKIRFTLSAVGFKWLQDSVWVYPYDCEDFIALLKADFKIGKDLLYLIVEEMEGDYNLKKHFGLATKQNLLQ